MQEEHGAPDSVVLRIIFEQQEDHEDDRKVGKEGKEEVKIAVAGKEKEKAAEEEEEIFVSKDQTTSYNEVTLGGQVMKRKMNWRSKGKKKDEKEVETRHYSHPPKKKR